MVEAADWPSVSMACLSVYNPLSARGRRLAPAGGVSRQMCCVIASLFALGPRAAILLWWLVEPVRWGATFDTFLWPFVGFLILPWTTLMYVLVFPAGITGFDFVWLAIAVAMDVFSWAGGGYTNRDRLPTSAA